MNIAFKSVNGSCPSFTHEGIRYYINDVEFVGKREYQLFSKNLDTKEIVFDLNKDLKDYLDDQKALYFSSFNSFTAYQNKTHLFRVEGLKVTVMHKEKAVGYSYERYIDCLKRAKEFLETIVNGDQPVQLSIWDLPKNTLKAKEAQA